MYTCEACNGLLDVHHDLGFLHKSVEKSMFDRRLGTLDAPYSSGVWRYKELVYPDVDPALIVSRNEGNTESLPGAPVGGVGGGENAVPQA